MNFNLIIDKLQARFPYAECELNYSTPFELLVAVMLSAQCTDKRVNSVTEQLFIECNTPELLAAMDIMVLEKYLYPLGFFKVKAKNLKAMAIMLLDEYKGRVSKTLDDLVKLPGVGRKTASVVLAEAFGLPAFAVDTHVLRVCNRLGLVKSKDPLKVEKAAVKLLSPDKIARAHILLVYFGRYTCTARNPKCSDCVLRQECGYGK